MQRGRKGQLELYAVMYVILVPDLRTTRQGDHRWILLLWEYIDDQTMESDPIDWNNPGMASAESNRVISDFVHFVQNWDAPSISSLSRSKYVKSESNLHDQKQLLEHIWVISELSDGVIYAFKLSQLREQLMHRKVESECKCFRTEVDA